MTTPGRGLFATILLAVLLAACSPGQEPLLARIEAGKTIRVGFANEPPYAYLDPETGELTGEAPEVARHVLGELGGGHIEGVLTEFGALIPGLKAGRFDVIAAGMYVTPERAKEIAFSDPTYSMGEAFLVKTGNPLSLHAYADVAGHATARLGVVSGAIELDYARKTGVPEERIVVFPDAQSALAGLRAGRIDAYAGTALTVRDLHRKVADPGLAVADPFEDPIIDGRVSRGYGAFGFRPADADAVGAVNAVLRRYIGSEEHLERVRPFGFTASDLPGGVTTADLLSR